MWFAVSRQLQIRGALGAQEPCDGMHVGPHNRDHVHVMRVTARTVMPSTKMPTEHRFIKMAISSIQRGDLRLGHRARVVVVAFRRFRHRRGGR